MIDEWNYLWSRDQKRNKDNKFNGMEDKYFQGYSNGCLAFHQKDKRKLGYFFYYSSNVSCLAIINDVMVNNFVLRITLKWNE